MNQRKSMSAAASASAMSDDAKSAEMLKQHEFAAGADPSERKKANEALVEITKAINFAESAMRCITIALRVGPAVAKRDIDVLRREFLQPAHRP